MVNTQHSPRDAYQRLLSRADFAQDPAQAAAVEALQRVYEGIKGRSASRPWWSRFKLARSSHDSLQGLYIWGGVGRGKSFLMDLFYAAVPGERKQRIHFHQFMQQIHEDLKTLGNVADPLPVIAAQVADKVDLICFDEMQVHDVADAMLLGGLLTALFAHGVVLVATSNRAPDQLYLNGLQRERFLLTITLIKQQMAVHHLSSETDYRYRSLRDLQRYLSPLSETTHAQMANAFVHASNAEPQADEIAVNDRRIEVVAQAGDVVWFDFLVLCGGPRSAADYLSIAERFHTLLLSGLPKLGAGDYDLAHRFMNLIDLLYDQRVNLIIAADGDPDQIYEGDRFQFEFERVTSRLIEMQSEAYLQSCRSER